MLLSRKLNISSSKMDVYNCFRVILESFGRDILEKLEKDIKIENYQNLFHNERNTLNNEKNVKGRR